MLQLSSFLWLIVALLAVSGGLRGWQKEVIASTAIVLGIFALQQLSNILIQPLTQGAHPDQLFYTYVIPFVILTFLGYQAPSTASRYMGREVFGEGRRRTAQETVLGAVLGGLNGFLIMGTIWYYLDVSGYPFAPFITAPTPGSPSAALVGSLPVVFLVQSNLLTVVLIILFVFVLVALI